MLNVLRSFALAFADAVEPRMMAIVLLPGFAAVLLWSAVGWMYWDAWTGWMRDLLAATPITRWIDAWSGWSVVLASASAVLVVALIIPVIFITAIVITELVAMPLIVRFVGDRYYPRLHRKAGGTWYGGALNTFIATVQFLLLWLITLPFWLTGIGALVLPALNSAYLNQRLFRYDALAEHASAAEYRALKRRAGGRYVALGLLLALIYYVPVLNLVAPVLTGLAFTHLCLGELEQLRRESGQKPAASPRA